LDQNRLQSSLQSALSHHRSGRLAAAEQIYRQILSADPIQPDALHLLGLIALQARQFPQAIDLISRALQFRPDWPEAICNLSSALNEAGRRDEAIAGYRRAVSINPGFAIAWHSLAGALAASGKSDQAIDAYRSAIAADPNYPDAHNNLGNALRNSGDLPGAIASYQRAIALRGVYPQAYNNMGAALQESGRLNEAIAAHRHALHLQPDYRSAKENLAIALGKLAQQQAAINQMDEAIDSLRQAIALNPATPAYHNNLGIVLFDAGRIDEAREAFDRSTKMQPDNASFASAFLSTLHYSPAFDAKAVAQAHFDYGNRFSELSKVETPGSTSPRQQRSSRPGLCRVRLGYVSADFRWHPVGRFLLPVLEQRDRGAFEVFCYSNVKVADATTARFRQVADHWRDTSIMDDDALAAQIRSDGIDILLDLSGHTSGNGLMVFARKPAPVQISYLGYAGTTGLSAIDYRLTDLHADPPGLTEHLHSERLIRLPLNWCFAEPVDSPPVLPRAPGPIRFCSFNHLCKVTDEMLLAWVRILQAVPHSELIFKAGALASPGTRKWLQQRLISADAAMDRVTLLEPTPGFAEHLRAFSSADIALDTFPYHGTTTTCEALWMGVPVITLAGQSHVSRVGVSLLNSVGLTELIADSMDQYIAIAGALAADRPRLESLRHSLRDRLSQSPLMDARRFARDFESALLATLV
jgi:predicted O-linked N-acetylglucosamine transferase (SPINDLY family)